MFKTALFDCAINEKCCSVDGGRGICPLFSSPPPGICDPRQKKCQCSGVSLGGGGRWAQLELTDAFLVILFISLRVLHRISLINPLVLSFLQFFTRPLDRSITYFFHSFILQYVRSSIRLFLTSFPSFERHSISSYL